ncbi:MAG: hypothetical protein IJD50_03965 [Clostridia bacterium]|nr:hypothetical protein [Clostridia bacterium]
MSYEYVYLKKNNKMIKHISQVQLLFRNGDFLTLGGREIVDKEFSFCDTLIRSRQGFSPFCNGGFIRCKIDKRGKKYDSCSLYNRKEYVKDRKTYIENRCVNEGGIYCVRFFDSNNWSNEVYGDIIAWMDEGYLVLKFQGNKTYGSANGEHYKINVTNVTKSNVEKICIDFENCDSFDVYQDEIEEIDLIFHKELEMDSDYLLRKIKSGRLKIKLDKENNAIRDSYVYDTTKAPMEKVLKKRLCGKGKEEIDVCHLYVTYQSAGWGLITEERILVPEIESNNGKHEQGMEEDFLYVSGYAEAQKDGSILIVFGENLK